MTTTNRTLGPQPRTPLHPPVLPATELGSDEHTNEGMYCKFVEMFRQNHELVSQVRSLASECQLLKETIQAHGFRDGDKLTISSTEKRKRHRRSAKQVERHFECSVCQKSYGYVPLSSEGSLKQHMKLKHLQG